jgi:hypothetical protein
MMQDAARNRRDNGSSGTMSAILWTIFVATLLAAPTWVALWLRFPAGTIKPNVFIPFLAFFTASCFITLPTALWRSLQRKPVNWWPVMLCGVSSFVAATIVLATAFHTYRGAVIEPRRKKELEARQRRKAIEKELDAKWTAHRRHRPPVPWQRQEVTHPSLLRHEVILPELTRPDLKQDRLPVELPGNVSDVCIGGGGRYVVMLFEEQRKLICFDVCQAEILWNRSTEVPVLLAANAASLVTVNAGERRVDSYCLATGDRKPATTVRVAGKIFAIAMGSASMGPLLVLHERDPYSVHSDAASLLFLDPVTWESLPYRPQHPAGGTTANTRTRVFASGDGRVFGSWEPYGGARGTVRWIILQGSQFRRRSDSNAAATYAVPSPHGQIVYSADTIRPGVDYAGSRPFVFAGQSPLPAVRNSSFYVRLKNIHGPRDPMWESPVQFELTNSLGFRYVVPGVELTTNSRDRRRDVRLDIDRQVLFYPEIDLLVTLGTSNTLYCHRVNVDAALRNSGWDYLAVLSSPPTTVRAGTTWHYTLKLSTSAPVVSFRLLTGPETMSVSDTGECRWAVGANAPPEEQEVTIRMQNANGVIAKQVFRLAVVPSSP